MRRKGSITKRCMVYIMSAMMMISPISASVAFPVWGYANEVDPDGDQNPPAEPQEASIGEDTPIAPAESQSGEGTGENNDQVINNETVEVNDETIDINNGTVETNNGEVETNNGTVTDNHGTVVNSETGVVTNNYFDGTVTNGTVTNNYGGTVTGAMVANQFWRVTCDIPADTTYVNGFVHSPDTNDTDNYIQVPSDGETQAVNASIKLTPNTNNVINAQNLNSPLDGEYDGTAFTYTMAKDGNDIIVTILSLEGNICLTDRNLQLVIEENTTTHTVTYKVLNGNWNDGTTADKEEQVIDQGNLVNIPDVGSKPSAGFKAGSWSPSAPDSEAAITGNVTYIYTYAQDESPTVYKVTVTNDGHGESYANKRSGVTGTRVTLREVPDDGYRFKQWEVISGGVILDNYRDYTTTFTINNADVVIKAHFEKQEEHTRENDYGVDNSTSEASWTPARAAQTIAVQKAEKQQEAGIQLATVQTLLRTFATKSARLGEAPTVINLDMTKVDILDPATVNLLMLNSKYEFNITISVSGGLTQTVKIPANFNFRPFIKADGTMNIHEVLLFILTSRI